MSSQTMPSGGARKKAGRPIASTTDRAIKRRYARGDNEIMPGQMLLNIARWHYGRFSRESRIPEGARNEDLLRQESMLAQSASEKAAPYYHPKIAPVPATPGAAGNLTLEQILRASFPEPAAQPEADGPVMIEAQANKDDAAD